MVVAAVSGGKDSTAMSLHLKELGIEHVRLFADTGWEHEDTDAYVRDYLPTVLGPIEHCVSRKYPGGFSDLVVGRGMFPSRLRRMCTQELKVFPLRDRMRQLQDEHGEIINAVGIRAEESQTRAAMPEWEWSDSFDCWVWRPLINWKQEDVIAIHQRHGVAPNPLYLKGATRVGCWPCVFARKSELRLVADLTPLRVQKIRDLESQVQAKAAARYAAKGETFESLGYALPTMFHDKGRRMTPKPIDEMIAWARTPTRKSDLLTTDDLARDGCMRWGLCETEPSATPLDGVAQAGHAPDPMTRITTTTLAANPNPDQDDEPNGFVDDMPQDEPVAEPPPPPPAGQRIVRRVTRNHLSVDAPPEPPPQEPYELSAAAASAGAEPAFQTSEPAPPAAKRRGRPPKAAAATQTPEPPPPPHPPPPAQQELTVADKAALGDMVLQARKQGLSLEEYADLVLEQAEAWRRLTGR